MPTTPQEYGSFHDLGFFALIIMTGLWPEYQQSNISTVLGLDFLVHHFPKIVVAKAMFEDINPARLFYLVRVDSAKMRLWRNYSHVRPNPLQADQHASLDPVDNSRKAYHTIEASLH